MISYRIFTELNYPQKWSAKSQTVYLSITAGVNETATLAELEAINEKWGKKYPYAISNWDQVLNQLIVLYEKRLTRHL